jgi:hypothetical protein
LYRTRGYIRGVNRTDPRHWLVDSLPLIGALWITWGVVNTWVGRYDFAFDLEWMEGGMLGHAWQLAQGRPIYAEPSLEHISFVYPPGYSAVLAALHPWVPLDYAQGRVISAACTLVAAALIAIGTWRQGGRLAPGLCAGALYLALFNTSGAFYDLVRPDAMGVVFLAAAVVLGLERHRGADVGSGLLLCCAFLVKHNLAAWGLGLLAAIWVRSGRTAATRFVVASAVPALLATGYLQWRTDGYFLTYLLGVPGSHPMVGWRAFPGTPAEMGRHLMPVLGFGALWVGWRSAPRMPAEILAAPLLIAPSLGAFGWIADFIPLLAAIPAPIRAASLFFLGIAICFVVPMLVLDIRHRRLDWRWVAGITIAIVAAVIGAMMRAHHGGFNNVFMPLHWTLCFGFGVIMARTRLIVPGWHGVVGSAAAMSVALWWTGSTLQLDRLVPSEADKAAGAAVVEQLGRSCEGRIFSPYAAWLPVRLGQEPSAHLIGIWDINHKRGPLVEDMAIYRTAAENKVWSCVVSGGDQNLRMGVETAYRPTNRLTSASDRRLLKAKSGWPSRPEAILKPR